MQPQPTFLVVDDNDLDVEKITRCFKRLKMSNPIVRARDGQYALEQLRGQNGHTALVTPYIILLDLNMPRMSGLEFLQEIRNDPLLHTACVYILTTSDRELDRDQANRLNIDGYIVKTLSRENLQQALSNIHTQLCSTKSDSAHEEQHKMTPSAQRNNTLVLIDDDDQICSYIRMRLENSDWQHTCFTDPEAGLDHLINNTPPDVLIVDVRMPRIDGDQVLNELAKAGRLDGVRVFVASSVKPPESIWKRFKPYNPTFLPKENMLGGEQLIQLLAA